MSTQPQQPTLSLVSPIEIKILVQSTDGDQPKYSLVDVTQVTQRALPRILAAILENFPVNNTVSYGNLDNPLNILRALNNIGSGQGAQANENLRTHLLNTMMVWFGMAQDNFDFGQIVLDKKKNRATVKKITATVKVQVADPQQKTVSLSNGRLSHILPQPPQSVDPLTALKDRIESLRKDLESSSTTDFCAGAANPTECAQSQSAATVSLKNLLTKYTP